MRGSIWPLQFGSPRDIEQAEAITTRKHKPTRKRIDLRSLNRCSAGRSPRGRRGEKWTFEITPAAPLGAAATRELTESSKRIILDWITFTSRPSDGRLPSDAQRFRSLQAHCKVSAREREFSSQHPTFPRTLRTMYSQSSSGA